MDEMIKFKSLHGFKGVLHDWHGEHYQLTITNREGEVVLHDYDAKQKTPEELRSAVLAVQKEIEAARHEEKEREKGWRQQELLRVQQEAKQRKESFKALKREIGKYVIRYKTGEQWKILRQNGELLQFETTTEAKACIEKLSKLHPGITFKQKKWIDKRLLYTKP